MSVVVDPPSAGEVRVWLADLDRPDWPFRELTALLDPSERERAAALASDRGRRRFVVAHGVLRLLAGRCAGAAPSSVAFVRAPSGRPS
jgi:4'-phosphopantetheinyl transferase